MTQKWQKIEDEKASESPGALAPHLGMRKLFFTRGIRWTKKREMEKKVVIPLLFFFLFFFLLFLFSSFLFPVHDAAART